MLAESVKARLHRVLEDLAIVVLDVAGCRMRREDEA
jgi:hypothetical protein